MSENLITVTFSRHDSEVSHPQSAAVTRRRGETVAVSYSFPSARARAERSLSVARGQTVKIANVSALI